MADELLSSIIRLENEIQEQLQLEQSRADAWLERVRTEEQTNVSRINQEQEEAARIALKEAQKLAEEEATAIERQEAERCQRLASLEDKELMEVLKRHLVGILPG